MMQHSTHPQWIAFVIGVLALCAGCKKEVAAPVAPSGAAAPTSAPTAPAKTPPTAAGGAAPSKAGDATPAPAPKSSVPLNALTFESKSYDFGKIKDDAPVKTMFHVSNPSDNATMKLMEIHPSCGCVTYNAPKTTFGPGESGDIEIIYNPVNRQGKDQKMIAVTVDDPVKSRVELTIRAEVIPRVWIEPMSLYLGECRHDQIAKSKIVRKVTLASRLPGFKITKAEVRDTRVKLRDLGVETKAVESEIESKQTYEVAIENDIPIGRVQTQIDITTNDAVRARIAIPIIFDSVGELRVSQNPMYLRMATAGQPMNFEAILNTRTNVAFKVNGVSVKDCPKMQITAEAQAITSNGKTSAYRILLRGETPPAGTMVTGTMVVATDIPGEETLEVPFNGFVPQSPVPLSEPQKH